MYGWRGTATGMFENSAVKSVGSGKKKKSVGAISVVRRAVCARVSLAISAARVWSNWLNELTLSAGVFGFHRDFYRSELSPAPARRRVLYVFYDG